MKHSITGPGALLGLIAILAVGLLVSQNDLASYLGGLVQVGSGGTGSSTLQVGVGRSGRLAERVAGSRTGEDRRRLWGFGGQSLSLEYQVTVERGRWRMAIEEVGAGRPTLWSTALERSGREQVSMRLPNAGNYEVVVRLAGFGGGYEVTYGLR